MADTRLVDLAVSDLVLDAAMARAAQVQEQERQEHGVSTFTLAQVARTALTKWKPPRHSPLPRKRLASHAEIRAWAREQGMDVGNGTPPPELRAAYRAAKGLTTRPFRFAMPTQPYLQARDTIHDTGYTVAGVVQAALEKFARTGKY